jgi:hypothetical protein
MIAHDSKADSPPIRRESAVRESFRCVSRSASPFLVGLFLVLPKPAGPELFARHDGRSPLENARC